VKSAAGSLRVALEDAASLADRISLNVEVPGPGFLEGLHTVSGGKRISSGSLAGCTKWTLKEQFVPGLPHSC